MAESVYFYGFHFILLTDVVWVILVCHTYTTVCRLYIFINAKWPTETKDSVLLVLSNMAQYSSSLEVLSLVDIEIEIRYGDPRLLAVEFVVSSANLP